MLALFDFCRSFGERLGWGAFVFLSTNDKCIDNSKGIIALDPREHNPRKHPWGIPASPTAVRCSCTPLHVSIAPSGCLPQWCTARRGTAKRGLDMQIRMGYDGVLGGLSGRWPSGGTGRKS